MSASAETPVMDGQPIKSKRPSSSAFKQQKLPAWQPILTAGTVLPTFFVIGIAFIPIGIGLLFTSNDVQEIIIDYTDCKQIDNDSVTCAEFVQENKGKVCHCQQNFTLDADFKRDVFIYYGLTNFYQNHRRYVKSRDDYQLLGNLKHVSEECEPYDKVNKVLIAPCGAIANSLFNDTFRLNWLENSPPIPVPVIKTGIAWPTDKNVKFRNPKDMAAFQETVKPLYWTKNVTDLDPDDPSNNGFKNEDFIVWMRTAALPTFRKLYRRVNHSETLFRNKLPKGQYTLLVNYAYPVKSFDGRKRVIISTTSWLGGKNSFLGIAYIVVGCICLVLGMVFLVIHIKFSKSTQEMVNVTERTGY